MTARNNIDRMIVHLLEYEKGKRYTQRKQWKGRCLDGNAAGLGAPLRKGCFVSCTRSASKVEIRGRYPAASLPVRNPGSITYKLWDLGQLTSVTQFPHLQNADNNGIHLRGLF